jgi:hypothetical protein
MMAIVGPRRRRAGASADGAAGCLGGDRERKAAASGRSGDGRDAGAGNAQAGHLE